MSDDADRDPTEVRFSLIELGAPARTAPVSDLDHDLGKARELRNLREQVARLTDKLASYQGILEQSQITTRNRSDDPHGYKCGFHPRVVVSEETRSVTCQVCHAELEPMDVLREFARGERRFVESLTGLREERQALLKEVAELKKVRSSLRSQVKKKAGRVAKIDGC